LTVSELQVTEIVRRVVAQLAGSGYKSAPPKCLAVFTGGVIGLEDVLTGLRELNQAGIEVVSLLSRSAEQIIGVDRIAAALDGAPVFSEDNPGPAGAMLQEVELVMVPVLTINTAAKVALGIADNLPTTVLRNAIIMGKPLVAVKNACDITDPKRTELGHNRGPAVYTQLVQDYLVRLASFGFQIIAAPELASTVKGIIQPSTTTCKQDFRGKKLVTHEDILNLKEQGGTVIIRTGTLVTPLARDVADKNGLEFVVAD
jgi:hypothetical protein